MDGYVVAEQGDGLIAGNRGDLQLGLELSDLLADRTFVIGGENGHGLIQGERVGFSRLIRLLTLRGEQAGKNSEQGNERNSWWQGGTAWLR